MSKPISKQKKPRLMSLGAPLERDTDKIICASGNEQSLDQLPDVGRGETSQPTWHSCLCSTLQHPRSGKGHQEKVCTAAQSKHWKQPCGGGPLWKEGLNPEWPLHCPLLGSSCAWHWESSLWLCSQASDSHYLSNKQRWPWIASWSTASLSLIHKITCSHSKTCTGR